MTNSKPLAQGGGASVPDQALAKAEPVSRLAPPGFDPSRGNGCSCRWCTYDRVFAEQIVKVSDPDARAVFEQLKEDWESAEHDAAYWRNYWAEEVNDAALATEARRAATGNTDAVHEGAGPKDNAQ